MDHSIYKIKLMVLENPIPNKYNNLNKFKNEMSKKVGKLDAQINFNIGDS